MKIAPRNEELVASLVENDSSVGQKRAETFTWLPQVQVV